MIIRLRRTRMGEMRLKMLMRASRGTMEGQRRMKNLERPLGESHAATDGGDGTCCCMILDLGDVLPFDFLSSSSTTSCW